MGARSHDAGNPLAASIVTAAVDAAGLGEAAPALDDERWDEAVRESHALAYASAGPDIGSPVLMVPGAERGIHGPILTEVPAPDDALTIWDSLLPLLRHAGLPRDQARPPLTPGPRLALRECGCGARRALLPQGRGS